MDTSYRNIRTDIKHNNITTMGELICEQFEETYKRKLVLHDVNFNFVVFEYNYHIENIGTLKLYFSVAEDVLYNSGLDQVCKLIYNMYELNFNTLFDGGVFDEIMKGDYT